MTWETILALWMVSGLFSQAAIRVATATFALFAVVSLAMAVERRASCACFGSLEISPWITAGLDSILVLALLGSASEANRFSRGSLVTGLLALFLGCSVVGAVVANHGSVRSADQITHQWTATK